MRDRKIFLILVVTILFAFIVIIWYFFGAKKEENPSITTPSNPFGEPAGVRPGGEFISTNSGPFTDNLIESERIPAEERILTQIWNRPVAGYSFITREIIVTATSTSDTSTTTPKKLPKPFKKTMEYLIFVDRITGHIYGYNKESSAPFQITNTTVAGIYDAYLVQNGTLVFMRYLDAESGTIKTVTATIPYFIEGADPHPLSGIKSLQDNISSFAISASSNMYSYLVPSYYGSSIYTVNQKGVVSVVTSPLKEWALKYGGEIPYITNRASAYLEGSTFSLPNKTYILGGKTGLMDLPNDTGTSILASMWSSSGLATFIADKKTESTQILSIRTLSSKCVWGALSTVFCGVPSFIPEGEEDLPDDWFQGTVSFSDNLYSVDALNGVSFPIFNLSAEGGNPFDMTRLHINKSSTSLVFTNKQGGTLWMINLSKVLPSN